MTERIKAILDAVTDKVLSYRPVDKGLAAKKTKRRLARRRHAPEPGTCQCVAAPIVAEGLCASCLDERA